MLAPRRTKPTPGAGRRAWRRTRRVSRRSTRRHFPSQLLWLAITFGLFYLFLKRVVLPRVGGILEVRRDRIAQDLDQAARMKDEADAAVAAYEQELAEARGQGQRDRPAGARQGQGRRRRRAQAVEAELESKLAEAEASIACDQGVGACTRSARSPRRRPPRSSSELIGGKVDKAEVAAAVKLRRGNRRAAMDATFWAFVALVIFIGIVFYMKVPGMIGKSLDERAERSATNSRKPAACAKKPSSCLPNTSASARKPRRRPPTSSPPPSARPSQLVAEAQQEDRGLRRPPHRACRAEDRPGRTRRGQRSARQRRRYRDRGRARGACRQGRSASRREAFRDVGSRREVEAQLSFQPVIR